MAQITLNSTGVASNGSLVLQSNGTTSAVTIDTAQNVGVGVTPSAWNASSKAFQIGASGNVFLENYNGVTYILGYNAYRSVASGYLYTTTGYSASLFGSGSTGGFQWNIAPSGTAGNAITFTQAMTLFASGALALGTTSDPTSGYFAIGPDSGKTANSLMWLANTGGRIYIGKESSAGGIIVNGTDAYAAVIATNNAYPLQFGTNNAVRATIDSSGYFSTTSKLSIGTAATAGVFHYVVGSNTTDVVAYWANQLSTLAYTGLGNVTYASGENAADAAFYVRKGPSTSRSINAAGTVNAAGLDYAEYMEKSGSFTINKGDICGIDANGKLTNVFVDAVSFMVKSTNPSYVGGDVWGNEEALGLTKPKQPEDDATDDEKAQYATNKIAFDTALEVARQKIDRISFCGQVPVNVIGATAGQYIIPVNNNGAIKGEAVSNPTFEQYQISVGKVIAIESDGRAKIIVKVA
jgi:hypothetical protein